MQPVTTVLIIVALAFLVPHSAGELYIVFEGKNIPILETIDFGKAIVDAAENNLESTLPKVIVGIIEEFSISISAEDAQTAIVKATGDKVAEKDTLKLLCFDQATFKEIKSFEAFLIDSLSMEKLFGLLARIGQLENGPWGSELAYARERIEWKLYLLNPLSHLDKGVSSSQLETLSLWRRLRFSLTILLCGKELEVMVNFTEFSLKDMRKYVFFSSIWWIYLKSKS